jgi:hypothetical protein
MPRASLFMKLEAKKLFFDVIKACRDFEEFTAGKAFYDCLENEMLRTAVERKAKKNVPESGRRIKNFTANSCIGTAFVPPVGVPSSSK